MNILIYCFLVFSLSFAQISHGGKPHYSDSLDEVPGFLTSLENKVIYNRDNLPQYFIFGDEYNVDIDFFNEALAYSVNGGNVYLLTISSPGAKAIGLEMDSFYLYPGVEMFIYNSTRDMFIGSFTSENNKVYNEFSTSLVKGDQVVIEVFIPNDIFGDSFINISKIIHDFTDLLNYHDTNNQEIDRNSCNINVACAEADPYEDQVNSVMLMTMGGGSCSASLINNVEEDLTPYVLTAEHCLGGSPNNYNFYFKYQSSSCNGNSGSYNYSMSGSYLRAEGEAPDFALLELTNNPPDSYDPYYNGWSNSANTPNDVYGIHHAGGGIKKISFTEDNILGQYNFWTFQFDDGRIYPGSSGSPLFDQNNRTIGPSSHMYTDYCYSYNCYCDQQYDVGYGRLNRAWEYGSNASSRIKDWLDPNNTGTIFMDGTSDGFSAEVSLSSPNGGEVWEMGSAYNIVWSDNFDEAVSIKLYKSGTYVTTIVSSTSSDGSFNWTVPGALVPGDDYKIKISSVNDASIYDYSNQDFSISGDIGEVIVGFGDIDQLNQLIEVYMINTVDIAGFQFDIIDTPDYISLLSAAGGTSEENGFLISTNESGTVLAFSLIGSSIPTGENILTNLSYSINEYSETEICLGNGIFSSVEGIGLPVNYDDCIALSSQTIIPGDINFDNIVDVLDIVLVVGEVLETGQLNNNQFLAADINNDEIINILDIVAVVNIILSQ